MNFFFPLKLFAVSYNIFIASKYLLYEAIAVTIYFYHLYILYRDRIQFNLIIPRDEMNEELNRPARGTSKLYGQS
jgi:hypothetical protein